MFYLIQLSGISSRKRRLLSVETLPSASFPVIVEGAGLGELVMTDRAAVRSLPTVGPAVSPEGGHVRETPPTSGTGMGLLSSVSPQVKLQIGFTGKLFITFSNITLEWFLARVDP